MALTGTPVPVVGYRPRTVAWLAQRYALRNLRAQVIISRMAPVTELDFDKPLPEQAAVRLQVLYTGPARVYSVNGTAVDYGGEDQAFSTTYISTPMTVGGVDLVTQVEDMIEVVGHDDAQMVDRWFRVMDVDGGGQFPVVRRHQVVGAARFPEWTYVEQP